MRLVWLKRDGGVWRYAFEDSCVWEKCDVSCPLFRQAVTVESAREDFGCVVPSRPVQP